MQSKGISIEKPLVSPDTQISNLGLRPAVVSQLHKANIYRLEDCAEASAGELMALPGLGRAALTQIEESLKAVGLELRASNPVRETWKRAHVAWRKPPAINASPANLETERDFGSTPPDSLRPADDEKVENLEPWIGAVARRFAREGVGTVGDLRELDAAGGRHMKGVGAVSWTRVHAYFSACPPSGVATKS